MPLIGADDSHDNPASNINSAFTRYVQKELLPGELLLKLVGTPEDMLKSNFQIMWEKGSKEDLTRIMEVKGMSKAEQKAVHENDLTKLNEATAKRKSRKEKDSIISGASGGSSANVGAIASEQASKATAYWKLKMSQASKYLSKKK